MTLSRPSERRGISFAVCWGCGNFATHEHLLRHADRCRTPASTETATSAAAMKQILRDVRKKAA